MAENDTHDEEIPQQPSTIKTKTKANTYMCTKCGQGGFPSRDAVEEHHVKDHKSDPKPYWIEKET